MIPKELASGWSVTAGDRKLTVTDAYLQQFSRFFLADDELRGRMSRRFLFDLYAFNEIYGITPQEIMVSIWEVERGDLTGGVKPATPFRKPPLKGLWHKHFFAARFLAANLLNVLENPRKKDALLKDILERFEGQKPTQEIIQAMVARVMEEYPNRANEKKLTGEWIVFAKHAGLNYYLCLSPHTDGVEGDKELFEQIRHTALGDFPELAISFG